jgi:hypothetical protein
VTVRARVSNGWTRVSVAVAAFAVVLPAATYAAVSQSSPSGSTRPGAVAFSFARSFTPAQADPRLVAALSNRPLTSSEFNFTPTAAKKRASQVRVAIRAQAITPQSSSTGASRTARVALASAAAVTALAPTAYNLGAGVGWRRFAVDGDVARVKPDALGLGGRDGALVGINYSINRRLTGRLTASADRTDDRVPALSEKRAYAVDVGGAFDINRRLSVTGGVRYRVEKDRLTVDQRRDGQAVYLGTAFKF